MNSPKESHEARPHEPEVESGGSVEPEEVVLRPRVYDGLLEALREVESSGIDGGPGAGADGETNVRASDPERIPGGTARLRPFERPDADGWTEGAWSRPRIDRRRVRFHLVWAGVVVAVVLVGLRLSQFFHRETGRPDADVSSLPISDGGTSRETPHAIAHRFAHATSDQERVALLRDKSDAEAMLAHFRSLGGNREAEVEFLKPIGTRETQGLTFHAFQLHFTDGADRFVAVVEEADGLEIDWKAYARWGTATWQEFLRGDVETAEMRVFARRSEYYNHGFSDRATVQAYEISSPDCGQTLYGYVDRYTPAGRVLEHFAGSAAWQRATLRLSRSSSSSDESNQVVISDLIATSWLDVGENAGFHLDVDTVKPVVFDYEAGWQEPDNLESPKNPAGARPDFVVSETTESLPQLDF